MLTSRSAKGREDESYNQQSFEARSAKEDVVLRGGDKYVRKKNIIQTGYFRSNEKT